MIKEFKTWMKFNPPDALSFDGWGDFREEFQEKAPVRYFIMEILVDNIRQPFVSMRRRYDDFCTRLRRMDRIQTSLSRDYHDTDTRMLYACFTLLVDYVEIECAWMQVAFGDKQKRNKHMGFRRYLPRFLRLRQSRSRQLGMDHLEWEASLGDPKLPANEQSPDQARRAVIIAKLYTWWRDKRPMRTEIPYPSRSNRDDPLACFGDRWRETHPEETAAISKWSEQRREQDQVWDNEDTEMLVKLIEIRKGLWT